MKNVIQIIFSGFIGALLCISLEHQDHNKLAILEEKMDKIMKILDEEE